MEWCEFSIIIPKISWIGQQSLTHRPTRGELKRTRREEIKSPCSRMKGSHLKQSTMTPTAMICPKRKTGRRLLALLRSLRRRAVKS
jgi:hypothetical protein